MRRDAKTSSPNVKTAIADGAETSLTNKVPASVGIGAFTSRNISNSPDINEGFIEGSPSNNLGPEATKIPLSSKSKKSSNPPSVILKTGSPSGVFWSSPTGHSTQLLTLF